jgi:protein SCO1/2
MTSPVMRRAAVTGVLGLLGAGLVPGAARADDGWHNIDVTGSSPALELAMTRATDGKQVTQQDFRGSVVLLYFGYTYCPDVCPLTLTNLGSVLDKLGKQASKVDVLFVTVDPNRDTLAILKRYTAAFGPQIVGLRGDQDELAALARRYRIAYSVTKPENGQPYAVTHSAAIYAFDATGAARLLIPSMASKTPDIDGTADDLGRLIDGAGSPGLLSHFLRLLDSAV